MLNGWEWLHLTSDCMLHVTSDCILLHLTSDCLLDMRGNNGG